MSRWLAKDAIALCRQIETIAPEFGAHVALTGGCLYKDGTRKDCDILLYRIRQRDEIAVDDLFEALKAIGIEKVSGFGWCHKATWEGRKIDFFFPEEPEGEYEEENDRITVEEEVF